MKLIDTHSHVYGDPFRDELRELIRRSQESGVEKVFLPNLNSGSVGELFESVTAAPNFFYPMMGLHPTEMPEDYKAELLKLHTFLEKESERFVAIGEIGLDYYWSTERKKEMQEAFEIQLQWACQYHLPVSIHSRSAVEDATRIVKTFPKEQLSGVFHSFTETEKELEHILPLEHFKVGINGVFTFKNSRLKTFIPHMLPLSRIVIETDAPYLSPVPHRGKRNEPSHLPFILKALSDAYELHPEEVAKQIYRNTSEIFPMAFKS